MLSVYNIKVALSPDALSVLLLGRVDETTTGARLEPETLDYEQFRIAIWNEQWCGQSTGVAI